MGRYCKRIAAAAALILAASPCLAAGNDIEQVTINMPAVTTYYRTDTPQDIPQAFLGGESLTYQGGGLFSETGEGAVYYVLLDISASIPSSRFEDIKSSLVSFRQSLRPVDQMVLITFGDAVTTVLDGSEEGGTADSLILGLANRDQNTLLFDAIDQTARTITKATDQDPKRRVMVVVSDGKDCADNTKTVASMEKNLTSNGIPAYTMAVENNEGDTAAVVTDYRSKFSAMASETGGIPWTVDQAQSVLDGFTKMREAVLNTMKGEFQAGSNLVSNQNEEFVLTFTDGEKDTVSVLVSRNQPDVSSPRILSVAMAKSNAFKITYSEAVDNAEQPSNYQVSLEGKALPVRQVAKADTENAYLLVFSEDLRNGNYQLDIQNVCDHSNEKNALEASSYELTVTDGVEEEIEEEAEPGLLERLQKWLPYILIGALALIVLPLVFFIRKIRKGRINVVDGTVVEPDDIGKKIHIQVDDPKKKGRNLVIWIGGSNGKWKRIEYLLEGSAFVGRNSSRCNIYCDDPTISGQHFFISEEADGNIYVTDLPTNKNGTYLNGSRFTGQRMLHPGDDIGAGQIHFRVEW